MPFVESESLNPSKTGQDIVEDVMRLFLSGQREELNKLNASVTAGVDTLSFKFDLGGIRAGSLVDIDNETYRVWSVDQEAKTAEVESGMNGTTSAAHTENSLVYVNPRLPRAVIFNSLNEELVALSSPANGLHAMKFTEFPYTASQDQYDLGEAGEVVDIWRVTTTQPGPSGHPIELGSWRLDHSANTTLFPSGKSVYIPYGIPGQTIRVMYRTPFATLSTVNDSLTRTAGVPIEMQDILVYGSTLRIGTFRELKRSFTEAQGDSRRAEEVPPNAVATSFSAIRQLYQERVAIEALRLMHKYPPQLRR